MNDGVQEHLPLRSVILATLTVCLLIAAAPWLSGGQEPLAGMLSAGALLLGALLAWRQPELRRLQWGPLLRSWGLLMGFALLSWVWTASRYSTSVWVTQWLLAGLAFWLTYAVAGERRGREWVIRGYLASALVFCAVAIWIYLTGSYDRLTGTFYWANPAAAYLMPAIILSLDRWRSTLNKKLNWWWLASVVLLATFGLTDSRGAMLVLVPVMALYLLVTPMKRPVKRFWITFLFNLMAAIGLCFVLIWVSTLVTHHSAKLVPGSRLAEVAGGESQSGSDRLHYLESGLEMWWQHPLVGTGVGTYGDVHPQYQHQVVSASTDAHNLYVQVLAELGIVGAVLLAGVAFWLIVGVIRGVVLEPATLALAVSLLALLLHFGLDIDAHYPALLALAAVLAGLVYRQHQERRRPGQWWPVVAALLVLVPSISLYQSEVWAQRAAVDQDNGDYDLAAEHYDQAAHGVVFNPDRLSAAGINWYTLGIMSGKAGITDLATALDRARTAERLDPHDAQHHQLEGRVLAAQGNLKGAQAALREALRLDPLNHPDYAADLAAWQLQAGDRAGARKTAQAMLDLYPDAVVVNRSNDATVRPAVANLAALVGNLDVQDGRLDDATAAAQRALRIDPGNLRARALQHLIEVTRHPAQAN